MSTTQPEALRLAAGLESIFISEEVHAATKAQAIAASPPLASEAKGA